MALVFIFMKKVKLTTEDFVIRFNRVHNGKYDYSKTNFIGSFDKIEIICTIHGSFYQQPYSHLNGNGCPVCGGSGRKNTKLFVDESKIIHNNKYDYSQVEYINSITKVKIICPIHGLFLQSPKSHIKGRGCQSCATKRKGQSKIKPLDIFITQSNIIHDNKYDYSQAGYINGMSKIKIICPTHGCFYQTPHAHLGAKQGCPTCAGNKKNTTAQFIEKSIAVHNDKYDYSKVEYAGNKNKIIIICKTHGDFLQQPSHHLAGHGCSKCTSRMSNMEVKWMDMLLIPQEWRQQTIKVSNRSCFVDAFDSATNTIYEFYGDFWHGNPVTHIYNDINHCSKKTFGELYSKTINRENFLKKNGFNIISIWENDFKLLAQ